MIFFIYSERILYNFQPAFLILKNLLKYNIFNMIKTINMKFLSHHRLNNGTLKTFICINIRSMVKMLLTSA